MTKNNPDTGRTECVLLAMFAVLLLVPLTFGLLGWFSTPADIVKIQEQRTKAGWPDLPRTLEQLERLPKAVERWFNDNFGLRSFLIRTNALLKKELGTSSNPDKVILGKDSWLFLGNRWANTLNQYMGRDPFSPEELESFVKVLQARSAWLEARGIPMVFAIAPDKNSIYPEYLPEWVTKGDGPTRREQLVARLRETGLLFVDTTAGVWNAKKYAPTFYKTDSHWNNYGAWVGYKSIMDFIRERVGNEGFRVIGDRDFTVEQSPKDGFALPQMLGLDGRDMPDTEVSLKLSKELGQDVEVRDMMGRRIEPEPSFNNPKIGKSSIKSVICRDIPRDGLKVLILRDSFTTNMSPYFNLSFRNTTYCAWAKGAGKEMTRLVDRYDVDLVLWILVERALKLPHGIHSSWRMPSRRTLKERWQNQQVIAEGDGLSLLDKAENKVIASVEENATGFGVVFSRGRRLKLRSLLSSGSSRGGGCLRLQVESDKQTVIQVRFKVVTKDGRRKWAQRTEQLYEGANDIFFELPLTVLMQSVELTTFKKSQCRVSGWQILKRTGRDV